jgi:NADH:ubiquinone oxidoreductase subunit 3 (subunit A)
MLTSVTVLQNALERYERSKKTKEKYNLLESGAGGMAAGMATGFLAVAIVFVALEFLVLFFAINVAFRCTQGGAERIVHLVLAVVFTLPYMLLNTLFNKCAVDVLRGGINSTAPSALAQPVAMGFGANKVI